MKLLLSLYTAAVALLNTRIVQRAEMDTRLFHYDLFTNY